MGSALGLELSSVRRQSCGWPRAGALLAASVLSGLAFALAPTDSMLALGCLLAVPAVLWHGLRQWHAAVSGKLLVDSQGSAYWWADGQHRCVDSVTPLQWRLARGLIWLRMHDAAGESFDLRLQRPIGDDSQWRAARRWLIWLERGGRREC